MFSLKSAIAGLSAVAALSFATASAAATVFNGVTLHRVEILGSTYDVTFHDGAFDTVFPNSGLTFARMNDANAAVDAIRATAAYQSFQPASDFAGFLVPFGIRDELSVWAVAGAGGGVLGWATWHRTRDLGNQLTWAQFNLSAVPEPATWAMMIVGFGAVGSMVRTSRRRSAFSA